jgi:redox-sensitive bicupin YhaK (pirin superfamily)
MISQPKAKIFLADERGRHETEWFRSMNTFNFGNYFNEHKTQFGGIDAINDESLDGGCAVTSFIKEPYYIILLPVIGAIRWKDSRGNEDLLAAGQCQLLNIDSGESFEISNPFNDELINYLQIWIKAGDQQPVKRLSAWEYDVNAHLNKMVLVTPDVLNGNQLPFHLSIGKFTGRGETSYTINDKRSALFAFVIEGAFELEGRLMHARDGLALWEAERMEMEALSNDAILLLIEIF